MVLMHALRSPVGNLLGRINEAALLPAFIVVCGGLSLAALRWPASFGAKDNEVSFENYYEALSLLSATEWLGVGVLVLSVGWMCQPQVETVVGVFVRKAVPESKIIGRWHRWLSFKAQDWEEGDIGTGKQRLGLWVRKYYPQRDEDIRISRLGNMLAAAEERAGHRYELHLPTLGATFIALLASKDLDLTRQVRQGLTSRMTATVAVFVLFPIAVTLFWSAGFWWRAGVPFTVAVTGIVIGLSARRLAAIYEARLRMSIALYRFELLSALHIQLPANPAEEKERFRDASRILTRTELSKVADFSHAPIEAAGQALAAQALGEPVVS